MARKKKTKIPQVLTLAENEFSISEEKKTRCEGQAYSGGPVRQWWSEYDVYIDLAGMEVASQIPLMLNHDYSPEHRLGVVDVFNGGSSLSIDGEFDGGSYVAQNIIRAGKEFSWQLSIGCENKEYEILPENTVTTINNREITGPAFIVRKSLLREVSIVAIGADKDTWCDIAASLMTPQQEESDAEEDGEAKAPAKETVSASDSAVESKIADTKAQSTETTIEINHEENTMPEDITAKLTAMESTIADLQAKLNEQASRPAPEITVPKADETPVAEVLSCAIEQSMGIEQKDTRAAEMASKTYKGQMGLRQLYTEAAQAAGWTGSYINNGNFAEATNAIKAGFSNINLPGILGNAVNKRIKAGYDYAESSWREIAETTSVSDYKAFSTYTLNAKGDFEEVPSGATIPHGELGESGYTNQLKRYGQMFQVDEIEIIDDDLGAINARSFGFGRKAALKLNKVFWAKFQDDAAVFSAANGNLVTSAGELNPTNLAKLVKAFRQQKDANGDILGYAPAVLLVPTALEVEALKIYNDSEIRDNTASKQYLTGNPWRSKFRPVASAYLTSDDDYYLLADPNIAATIQVAFLDGQTAPTIESSAAEFDVFGIRWRAKFSFGVAFADPKAGIKGDKA